VGDLSGWQEARNNYYQYIHREKRGRREPYWRGVRVVKYPTDLILYAMAIQENHPDYIVEAGSAFGGSAMFFADMMTIFGGQKVYSIDIAKRHDQTHPKAEFIIGSSIDPLIVEYVRQRTQGARVMVVLDSDHSRLHVCRELKAWGRIVTKGQFLVVEDCYTYRDEPFHPKKAVDWYLRHTRRFKLEPYEDRFIFAVTRGGWLRKVAE